ncbi:uncharacterized protein [Diabrotica undecimpunctata]|uniref:uncharacterized protein n=1 Tax=Diabrotica undecimpunctata TaxID=50387 RepID=UPI003B63DAD6
MERCCSKLYSILRACDVNTIENIINIIQVYAPTADKDEEEIEQFYNTLNEVMRTTKRQYINIVLGALNAKNNGCKERGKEEFWRDLDCEMLENPVDEKCFIGGDLNGHISTERAELQRVHGVPWDSAAVNTFFIKTEDQYVTYSSDETESQINFVLCRRSQLKDVKNCKVIKGECVAN